MSVSSYKVRVVVVFTKRWLGQSRLVSCQAIVSKTSCARLVEVRPVLPLACERPGCTMTSLVICRYDWSVFCKSSFVVCCCREWPSSLEKVFYLLSKLYVRVLSVVHQPKTTWRRLLTNVKDKTGGQTENSIQNQMLRLKGHSHWWNRHKPYHATDWTQTSDRKWCQLYCWAPFTDETSNRDWDSATCITYSTDYY